MNPLLLLLVPFALAMAWAIVRAVKTGINAERAAMDEEKR